MQAKNQVTCWVVTDGRAGMENQCLGLAEAMGLAPEIKRIKLRAPWKQLSPYLKWGLRWAVSDEGDSIAPPWPDLLIASGRASVPASLYVRQASAKSGGKRTVTVQIQNPVIAAKNFDLIVTPEHDGLSGEHVLSTRGGLHRITRDLLEREANSFAQDVAHLPCPRIAVLIGGSNSTYRVTPEVIHRLCAQLKELVKTTGGSLLVTPSRRTGAENIAALQEDLLGLPAFVWDMEGRNPYFGMLGLADYILVTMDSVNLASEACSTGKPVYVVDLPGGTDKFRRFHKILRDAGMTRPFEGRLENWSYAPLDDVQRAAKRVFALFRQIRSGSS